MSAVNLFNSLPNEDISDWSILEAFANDKIKVTKTLKLVVGRLWNIAGKGENAGYQHFLLFPQWFHKTSLFMSWKVGIAWRRVQVMKIFTANALQHSFYNWSKKVFLLHSWKREKPVISIKLISPFFSPPFFLHFESRNLSSASQWFVVLKSFQFRGVQSFVNWLSQTTNFRLFQTQRLMQTIILNLMKMVESSPKGQETLWKKQKLLVMSNFSLSHSVFKRLVLQIRKDKG